MNDQPVAERKSSTRQVGFAIAKGAVSLALIYLLFQTYDLRDALDRIARIDLAYFFAAAGLLTSSIMFASWRWRIIIGALSSRISFKSTFGLVWISVFFNQVLPSNLGGDAVRIWMFYRRDGLFKRAFGSVLLDRVTALVGLAILVLITFPLAIQLIADSVILTILGILVVTVFVGMLAFLWLDRIIGICARFLPSKLFELLAGLAEDSRVVLAPRRSGIQVLGISVVNHLVIVLVMYALAQSLSIGVQLVDLVVLIPPVVLAALLPISFAGWGVREGAMIGMLGTIGVTPENALALSVAFGFLTLIVSLPGALIWFFSGNRVSAMQANVSTKDDL
ncbi:MAG: hypothetical protein CMM52_10110 [Rhodospirillaceae bacterium]|nr:hypothetical protein [Rhodospirillaceae bacterium]|tara:strand:- start:21263 stop:22270 length:1008 start_codon:yes stop_codon:yes gene_type:complete